MTILITGGSGFVGRELIKRIKHSNQFSKSTIINIDKVKSNLVDVTEYNKDITEMDIFRFDSKIDACVHLASAVGGIIYNQDNSTIDYNNKINENLVRLLRKNQVKKLIFMSSINVCENFTFDSIDIPESNEPVTEYAKSKYKGEKLFQKYFSNLDIIRPTNIYGRSQLKLFTGYGESHAIPDLIHKIKNSTEFIEVWGTGEQIRNFIHVTDVCDFIIERLCVKNERPKFYNIRSDIFLTINQLTEHLMTFCNKNLIIRNNPYYNKYEKIFIKKFSNNNSPKINDFMQGLYE